MPITPTPFPTSTAAPLPTPYPTLEPNPTGTAMPVPTDTPLPTLTPNPTTTGGPVPTDTPLPTLAPNPTGTAMPVPTDTPLPTLPPPPTLPPAPTLAPIPVQQFVWGRNDVGQLGLGNTSTAFAATPMGNPGEYAYMQVNNNQGGFLKYDGSLWLAGINNLGQLGNGTRVNASSPVQEMTESDWVSFSIAPYGGVMGVKDDGSLWGWGSMQYVNVPNFLASKPVQIGTTEDWATVGCGRDAYYAIKQDGSMYAMGTNAVGQLGTGAASTVKAVSPTPIMSGTTDWSKVYGSVQCGFALKTDGSLYGWGLNTGYQLGDGTNVNRSEPVQIGSGITFTDVAPLMGNSVGLATDGAIYGWGPFSNGAQDNGVVNGRYSVPTQISSGNYYDFLATSNLATDVVQSGVLYTAGNWGWGELATSGLVASGYPLRTSFGAVPESYSWIGLANGGGNCCGGFAVLPTATPSPTDYPMPSPTPPVFLMIPFNFNFATETLYPSVMGFTFGNTEVTNDMLKLQYVSNETELTTYTLEISNSSEHTVYVTFGNDTYALAPFTQGDYELPMIFGSIVSVYCEGNVTIPAGLITGSVVSL